MKFRITGPTASRVEATNEDGDVFAAEFFGPGAEERAKEYACWKNGDDGPDGPPDSPLIRPHDGTDGPPDSPLGN